MNTPLSRRVLGGLTAVITLTGIAVLAVASPAEAFSLSYVQVTRPLQLTMPFSGATTQFYEADVPCPVGTVPMDASIISNAMPLALDWDITQAPNPTAGQPPTGFSWTVIGRSERPLGEPAITTSSVEVNCLNDTTTWPTLERTNWNSSTDAAGQTVWNGKLSCPAGMQRLNGGYWNDQVNNAQAISVTQNEPLGTTAWSTTALIPGAGSTASGEVFEYCLPTSFFPAVTAETAGLTSTTLDFYTGNTPCPARQIPENYGYALSSVHSGVYHLEDLLNYDAPTSSTNTMRLFDKGGPGVGTSDGIAYFECMNG